MQSDLRRAYAILDLSPPVNEAALKRQYRELAKRWHPDRYAADPIGQTEATQRMRAISDAYHILAAALETSAPIEELPITPRQTVSGLARQDIDEIIASVNRARAWSLRPRMSLSRWLSVWALIGYFLLATAILPGEAAAYRGIASAVGRASRYFWLPLFLIWSAEAEGKPREWLLVFRTIGWILMAAPALVGAVLWAWH